MNVTIRPADEGDVAMLVRHRIALRAERFEASGAQWDALSAATARAYVELMQAGEFFAWVACDEDGATVGSVGMLLRRALPRLGGGASYDARVQAMWVDANVRRRGIGRALLESLLVHARALDVRRVELHTSEDGRQFYPRLGFAESGEMELWLSPPRP